MTFVDEFNRPLPAGTALKDPRSLHERIVGYVLQTEDGKRGDIHDK